jgi:hypothetical protein
VNALLYARTGDERVRELAVRALNYATYFARSDGRISCCGQRPTNTYWFSDGYADYLRSFSWAMSAMPELAPKREDHLLGSTSVVQTVTYRNHGLSYRTFDADSVETLRLSYVPRRIVAGTTVLRPRADLESAGYSVRPAGGGDFIVRIRHDSARRIRIDG